MFFHLNGLLTDINPNSAVIECGEVGYYCNITANSASKISGSLNEKVKLYITEIIREDCFDLYGFASLKEKKCFDLLITVSGIGPKAALSILSANTPENFELAILNNDEKVLTAAQGVGKKIAQRVILELKDKISAGEQIQTGTLISNPISSEGDLDVNNAISGLSVLGYSHAEIMPILRGIDTKGMTAEAIIKVILKQMK